MLTLKTYLLQLSCVAETASMASNNVIYLKTALTTLYLTRGLTALNVHLQWVKALYNTSKCPLHCFFTLMMLSQFYGHFKRKIFIHF